MEGKCCGKVSESAAHLCWQPLSTMAEISIADHCFQSSALAASQNLLSEITITGQPGQLRDV